MSINYFGNLNKIYPEPLSKKYIFVPNPYINSKKDEKIIDKSDYFASITSITGGLNGTLGPLTLDMCKETYKY